MCTGDNAHTGLVVARNVGMLALSKNDDGVKVILGDITNSCLSFVIADSNDEIELTDLLTCDPSKTELVLTSSAFNALALPESLPDSNSCDEHNPLLGGTAPDLVDDVSPAAPILELMPMVRVLARMKPNDKVQTIRLLQDRGLVVGMV